MVTKEDYTVKFMDYGDITVPKGTKLTHNTALGVDTNYHFVNEYGWIDSNYSTISNILRHDVRHHGINVPKEFVDYGK